MKKGVILIALFFTGLLALGMVSACAETKAPFNPADYYIPDSYVDENGTMIPYQLHLPENMEEGKTYPLILFMHGSGFSGSDNRQVINGTEITICNNILKSGPECIILAPQTPSNWMNYPAPAQRPRGNHPFEECSTGPYLECALSLMRHMCETYPVDTARLYYYGYSMGAITGWYVLATHTDTFAAAILAAGIGSPEKAAEIAKTPVYVYHGTADELVSFEADQILCQAVQEAGGEVVFKVYEKYNHSLSSVMRADRDVIGWLFSKSRQP